MLYAWRGLIQALGVRKGAFTLKVLETERLTIRRLSTDDAEFMLELLNDPSWVRFIGETGARTVEDAREYILKKVVEMYERLGFGLYLTELKEGSVPIGICGLIKRDSLEDVDIGFAFLPKFREKGYACEAASAVMEYGRNVLGLARIVAITTSDNHASIRLLEKMGFQFEKTVRLSNDAKEVMLFGSNV
jgi:RimJ/RimL family protein N-acetyltransferase